MAGQVPEIKNPEALSKERFSGTNFENIFSIL